MRPPSRDPVWIPAGSPPEFPDPRGFEPHGLIAGGGDLSSARLLAAYRAGIFPWYDEPPILWWSPDPRAVLSPQTLHISRSLKRRIQRGDFRVSVNQALEPVLDGCGNRPEGTWLSRPMRAAYLALAQSGHIRSYEVWQEGVLVGGLYGVVERGLFAAESMFHTASDASKVALVCSVLHLFAQGTQLYDVQFLTEHLVRMGAREIPRADYLDRVATARTGELKPIPDATDDDLLPWVIRKLSQATGAMVGCKSDGE